MKLTTEGIIFMILVWGTVASFTIYCFIKVLRTRTRYDDDQDEE